MKKIKLLKGKPFAHRGLHNQEIKENTIEAFENALNNDFGIELDVRLTTDKEVVVIHDRGLKDLIGHNLDIDEVRYLEVEKYGVPKLSEVLELIEKKKGKVLIEIKESYDIEELMKRVLFHTEKLTIEHAIISFDPRVVKWFKEKDKIAGLTLNPDYPKILFSLITKGLINYANPDFLVVEKNNVNAIGVKRARNKMKVISWTITNKEEENKTRNFSDNFIFDDYQ